MLLQLIDKNIKQIKNWAVNRLMLSENEKNELGAFKRLRN